MNARKILAHLFKKASPKRKRRKSKHFRALLLAGLIAAWLGGAYLVFWALDSLFVALIPHWSAHAIAALLTLSGYPPLYLRCVRMIRKFWTFLRQVSIVWSFSGATRTVADSQQLGSLILSSLFKALGPHSAFLWLRDSNRHQFVLSAHHGPTPPIEAIPEFQIDFLPRATGGGPFLLKRDHSFFHPDLKALFQGLEVEVVLPLVFQGYLVGVLALSRRWNGLPYKPSDLKAMTRLSGQAAIAMSGMRLIEESKRDRTRLSTLLRLYFEAQQKAVTDGLTGLFTHAYFQEQLTLHCFEANRYSEPLALMLIDIDHFKSFNDTYGHQMGDEVLRQVAKVVRDAVRGCDVVARYGGEELAVIMPKTDLSGASSLAERIRAVIAEISIRDLAGSPIRQVTASVGVAELPELQDAAPADLVERADQALYEAKRNGRNQVCRCA
ncbi:MAG: diguanylate cyclase [Bacteroidota bacterium]